MDANGIEVGLFDAGLRAVALSYQGKTTLLQVTSKFNLGSAAFTGPYNALVCFESNDCSGPAWIRPPTDDVLSPLWAATWLPGVTMYFRDDSSAPEAKTMLSCGYADFNNPGGLCSDGGGGGLWFPTVAGPDLSTLFTPPFRIK